jgi:hypothetical protein
MLKSAELKETQIFSCLNEAELLWLSQHTADVHLEPGDYLIHGGGTVNDSVHQRLADCQFDIEVAPILSPEPGDEAQSSSTDGRHYRAD